MTCGGPSRCDAVVLQVCLATVGLVCDLCRALMSNILPYCDEIMQLLLENLGVRMRGRGRCWGRCSLLLQLLPLPPPPQNENVHRSVKPQILSAFGDIALAIGGEFKKYLDIVLDTLQQASQAQVDKVRRGLTPPPSTFSHPPLTQVLACSVCRRTTTWWTT